MSDDGGSDANSKRSKKTKKSEKKDGKKDREAADTEPKDKSSFKDMFQAFRERFDHTK
jgi:hypothetical protein